MSFLSPTSPIGIFDSGIGGLTVYKAVRDLLPYENIIYLGDTARVPYGTKSSDVVRLYSKANTEFLLSKGVKVVVVACNTASASSVEFLREVFPDIFIMGVIDPTVAGVASHFSAIRTLGVIGTRTTIACGVYEQKIAALPSNITMRSQACPLFVPLVEEGLLNGKIVTSVIHHYLSSWKNNGLDALLLGCTHYPLLIPALYSYFDDSIQIVDSAHFTAKFLQKYLQKSGLLNTSGQLGEDTVFVTDDVELFTKTASIFMHIDNFSFFHTDVTL